jgi:hypothetical protein
MLNINKFILFSLVSFIIISSVYADSLIEKVTIPNSYIATYVNFNKTYNSPLFKYINERLEKVDKNKVNQADLYRNIIKVLKKYNLNENDFKAFASTIGLKNPNIASLDKIEKSDINFAFGFSLTKSISFSDLDNIIKDIIKNEKKVTSAIVTYKSEKYIRVVDDNEVFYITTLPENKIILGSETQSNLHLLINNIKHNKHILFTPELSKIYSKLNKKSSSYFALALPDSITKNITTAKSFKNEGIKSIDTEIFKNIKGLTLQADINSDLVLKVDTSFTGSKAAKAFDLLLNQFIPTFKIMLFMSAKGPLPMLNTVKNSLNSENVVDFYVKISKQDIKTLYKFISSKNGVESLSKIVNIK